MLLAKVARDVLCRPDAPAAEVGVAVVVLAEATRQGLDVPLDAAALLWSAIMRSPAASWASEAALAVGLLAKRDLVVDIVGAITHPEAGRELRRAGLDVLSEACAGSLMTDGEILGLVEIALFRPELSASC